MAYGCIRPSVRPKCHENITEIDYISERAVELYKTNPVGAVTSGRDYPDDPFHWLHTSGSGRILFLKSGWAFSNSIGVSMQSGLTIRPIEPCPRPGIVRDWTTANELVIHLKMTFVWKIFMPICAVHVLHRRYHSVFYFWPQRVGKRKSVTFFVLGPVTFPVRSCFHVGNTKTWPFTLKKGQYANTWKIFWKKLSRLVYNASCRLACLGNVQIVWFRAFEKNE